MDEVWTLARNVGAFAVILVVFNVGLHQLNKRFGSVLPGRSKSVFERALHFCAAQSGKAQPESAVLPAKDASLVGAAKEKAFVSSALKMAAAAIGLQVFYLTWGMLQERVMTGTYGGEKFGASEFLVFSNRLAAFTVASFMITFVDKEPARAPFRLFSLPAFSNIISSWCQYSALKFVSFPVQVVFKSNKIIPVMIMGRLIASKSYQWWEYLTAAIISSGILVFMMGEKKQKPGHVATNAEAHQQVAGMCLLVGYIIFDSFTSQFQGKIFKKHSISPYRMMRGINFFSILFTVRPFFFRRVYGCIRAPPPAPALLSLPPEAPWWVDPTRESIRRLRKFLLFNDRSLTHPPPSSHPLPPFSSRYVHLSRLALRWPLDRSPPPRPSAVLIRCSLRT